jgi:hypothetical protein
VESTLLLVLVGMVMLGVCALVWNSVEGWVAKYGSLGDNLPIFFSNGLSNSGADGDLTPDGLVFWFFDKYRQEIIFTGALGLVGLGFFALARAQLSKPPRKTRNGGYSLRNPKQPHKPSSPTKPPPPAKPTIHRPGPKIKAPTNKGLQPTVVGFNRQPPKPWKIKDSHNESSGKNSASQGKNRQSG